MEGFDRFSTHSKPEIAFKAQLKILLEKFEVARLTNLKEPVSLKAQAGGLEKTRKSEMEKESLIEQTKALLKPKSDDPYIRDVSRECNEHPHYYNIEKNILEWR